jgi:hypothetical protein
VSGRQDRSWDKPMLLAEMPKVSKQSSPFQATGSSLHAVRIKEPSFKRFRHCLF